jgi:hypothetical protein
MERYGVLGRAARESSQGDPPMPRSRLKGMLASKLRGTVQNQSWAVASQVAALMCDLANAPACGCSVDPLRSRLS